MADSASHQFEVILADGSQWIVRQDDVDFPPRTPQFVAASRDDEMPRWNIDSSSIIAWKRL